MFITKKRFQEEITKAKKDAEEEMYRRQEMDDRDRWLHERIDRLEKRLWQLENPPVTVQGETCEAAGCCDPANVRPACY